jgi:hypothetical protein
VQRRNFLHFSSLCGVSSLLSAEKPDSFRQDFQKVSLLIAAVQEHMFPEKSLLPSAKKMHAAQFLFDTMADKTFNPEIRQLIIKGAARFEHYTEGKFTLLTAGEKEYALRSYEMSEEGKRWLSQMMVLTLEGLFGDPIYGSNIDESGWQALHVEGGMPRPKTRYIGI